MKHPILATAALLVPALAAHDGVQRERLPADVELVLHLDLEGLQKTELWKHLAQGEFDIEEEIDALDELRRRFGIDPLIDLRSLTVYQLQGEDEPSVALFTASTRIEEALRELQKQAGYRKVEQSGIELHAWQEEGEHGESVFAYLYPLPNGDRVAVVASSAEHAARGARVLRGEEENHGSGGGPLSIQPAPGSFLYLAASTLPGLEEFTPASRVYGLAQGIQVDLGEAGGFLHGRVAVSTGSPEDARNVADVVQGLRALASLAAHEGPKLESLHELLGAVGIETRGNDVVLGIEFEVARLVELLGEHEQEPEAEPERIPGSEREEVRRERRR
jgi:hypothetical protein